MLKPSLEPLAFAENRLRCDPSAPQAATVQVGRDSSGRESYGHDRSALDHTAPDHSCLDRACGASSGGGGLGSDRSGSPSPGSQIVNADRSGNVPIRRGILPQAVARPNASKVYTDSPKPSRFPSMSLSVSAELSRHAAPPGPAEARPGARSWPSRWLRRWRSLRSQPRDSGDLPLAGREQPSVHQPRNHQPHDHQPHVHRRHEPGRHDHQRGDHHG